MEQELFSKLDQISEAIELNSPNFVFSVWMPIAVVFFGAFLSYVFSLWAKRNQRSTIKFTVVCGIRETFPALEQYLDFLKTFIEKLKGADDICPIQLKTNIVEFPSNNTFSYEALTDALVSRLDVSNEELRIGAPSKVLFMYWDSLNTVAKLQKEVMEKFLYYNHKMFDLTDDWNDDYIAFSRNMVINALSSEGSGQEKEFYTSANGLFKKLKKDIEDSGGKMSVCLLDSFFVEMDIKFNTLAPTPAITESNVLFLKLRGTFTKLRMMTNLHCTFEDYLGMFENHKDRLTKIYEYYSTRKIKGIFKMNNRFPKFDI